MIASDTFCFLNQKGNLADVGWDHPDQAKLWRYNQHYFDDLNAVDAGQRGDWHRELIARWIVENPPTSGSGWEPYPTSLRIVNWVKWALAGNDLTAEMRQSLAAQTRWLLQRLEWHLLGNHLFVNAKALVYAGSFFEGDEAERWLKTGRAILGEAIPEQILPDGAQFELSPMYHALAVEDMLDLANIDQAYGKVDLTQEALARLPDMLEWLAAMSHPDGYISFFNDAAHGIAPDNEELIGYAEKFELHSPPIGQGVRHFESSGYARLAAGPAVLIADLATIGPDYLPGHAHADTLSFELSLFGVRMIVNSGTSVYGLGPERLRQRGTAAHSTLVVDGENSSEVWSGFRVGRRAQPHDVEALEQDDVLLARGSHDGYAHLPGRPIHRREWRLTDERLLIRDRVGGSGQHEQSAYFHLAPGIEAIFDSDGNLELRGPEGGFVVAVSVEGGECDIIPSTWHAEFGLSHNSSALRVRSEGKAPTELATSLSWKSQ